MRSGPIEPEVRTLAVDRRDVSYALWEQSPEVTPNLPWPAAASLAAQDVASLLSSAHTAALVVGRSDAAAALVEHTLAQVKPPCRLYVYGSSDWEADSRMRSRLGALVDRVLTRLGFDAPADWLVVDGGRAALLLMGPAGQPRRWSVQLDGPLALTLYEAFRVLFWFHAAREGLPDTAGTFGFRTPLAAPFVNPGNDVPLRSGRLVISGRLPEAIDDAELRIVTHGAVSGRAGIVFLPPNPQDFAIPRQLAGAATRVVWSDVGLPRAAISLERFVVDLVQAPVSLQLEWPRTSAIDMYHRLIRVAKNPLWQFYPQRRLADTVGPVLLQGAGQAAVVKESEVVPAHSVTVSPEEFDGAQPARFPDPPLLVRSVTYKWTVLPTVVPSGAREAELVRRWRAVDEWAVRQIENLRQTLARMEGEENGFLDRLRRWLPGHKDVRQHRSLLLQQMNELGEAPPSQRFSDAAEVVQRISAAAVTVRKIIEKAHAGRLKAEDLAAEEEQRKEWTARVGQAARELATKRTGLARLKEQESARNAELEDAESKLTAAIEASRKARRAAREAERDLISTQIDSVNQKLLAARSGEGKQQTEDGKQQPGGDKQHRKALARSVSDLEQKLARIKRDLDTLASWSPIPTELAAEREVVNQARTGWTAAREAVKAGEAEVARLETLANEEFGFTAPPRLPGPVVPQDAAAPAVPDEEPPELGRLFESQGKRFLAIKTWEQVPLAMPVARRLRAEIVCLPDNNK